MSDYRVSTPAGMNETFARAFNSRDVDNLLSLYEPDAALVVDDTGTVLRGTTAITSALTALLQAPGVMRSVNNFCVEHGDLALLRADWALADGDTLIASGSTAEVVRRQPDGAWLYVIDHAAGASVPRAD